MVADDHEGKSGGSDLILEVRKQHTVLVEFVSTEFGNLEFRPPFRYYGWRGEFYNLPESILYKMKNAVDIGVDMKDPVG